MSMWGRYTLRERTRGQPLTGGQEELRTTVISFDIPVVGSLFVIPPSPNNSIYLQHHYHLAPVHVVNVGRA